MLTLFVITLGSKHMDNNCRIDTVTGFTSPVARVPNVILRWTTLSYDLHHHGFHSRKTLSTTLDSHFETRRFPRGSLTKHRKGRARAESVSGSRGEQDCARWWLNEMGSHPVLVGGYCLHDQHTRFQLLYCTTEKKMSTKSCDTSDNRI